MSLLGIDLGTTTCKAAVFDSDGVRLAQAWREYTAAKTPPGRSELDSHNVWAMTREVIAEVVASCPDNPVTALCVSSMGEAAVPLGPDREILGNSILSSDPRGRDTADRLAAQFDREALYAINPNLPGPQYTLPKLLWLQAEEPDLFNRTDRFLLWGDAVCYLLGGEAVCNSSLANRTLLMDFAACDWSDRLLAWSGIDRDKLGRIVPGGTIVGTVSDCMAAQLGLPQGVTIVAGGHDQCCNALGCGVVEPGHAVCGLGTYECITPVFGPLEDPLQMLAQGLNIEHHVLPGRHVAFLFNQAGSLVRWFRDTFAAESVGHTEDLYGKLDAEMPEDPTRVLVLPHFEPVPWPRYIADTAGVIMGLHTDTTRGAILKAIREGVTMYFVDAIDALRRIGIDLTELVASGGGARSDGWLQIKADVFGLPVTRLETTEGGLAGAAMLAGLSTGVFDDVDDAVRRFVKRQHVFIPDADRHEVYREKHALFKQVYPANKHLLRRL